VKQIGNLGTKVLSKHRVTDVIIDHNLQVKTVVCGDEILDADAIIFSAGITGLKQIVSITPSLQSYE
jgi:flavin-dependent dehydrogenase